MVCDNNDKTGNFDLYNKGKTGNFDPNNEEKLAFFIGDNNNMASFFQKPQTANFESIMHDNWKSIWPSNFVVSFSFYVVLRRLFPHYYVYCSTKMASQQLFGKEIKMSIFKLFTFETQYKIFCILNVISLLLKALCNLRVFSYDHDCKTFLNEFSENFSRKIYLRR